MTTAVARLRSLLTAQDCGGRRRCRFPATRFFSSSSYTSHLFDKIGFVGLGNMGSRMADNLIKAGYDVAVHDINHDVRKRFSEKGIPTKESPIEIAERSDVVITMLPSSRHVIDVYTGEDGLLAGGSPVRPWLFIDSSTIDPQTSRNVSAAVSDCSLKEKLDGQQAPSMLDAPVSGGVVAAETGNLTFMVGGSEEAYMAAKPLFLSMGKNTIYCGGSGNGSTAKICNNLAMAVSMLGVSEAFSLGQSLGITPSSLTQVFNSSSARCWSRYCAPNIVRHKWKCYLDGKISIANKSAVIILGFGELLVQGRYFSDTYNPVPGVMGGVPSSRNYEGGFMSKLMLKDLNLAQTSIKSVGLNCPLASQAAEIYAKLCSDGYENKDFSCVFRYHYSGKDEHLN